MQEYSLKSHLVDWEDGHGLWVSERSWPEPKRVLCGGDQIRADDALQLWRNQGVLVWRGDYHQAHQLLQAVKRRIQTYASHAWRKAKAAGQLQTPNAVFALHRQLQGEMATYLHRLLLPVAPDYTVPLRRAPDVRQAINWAWPQGFGLAAHDQGFISMRELLGMVGAAQWRSKGLSVPALGDTSGHIVPFYGVYSPVRGEYLQLLAQAPWPQAMQNGGMAMDVGTGTGVVAALLVRRGASQVWATDTDLRAIACAQHNLHALGLASQVQVCQTHLFAPQRVGLVVCNPPWLPAQPTSPLEHAVYDPEHAMLWGFIAGVKNHLLPGGQAWLVLSDLAEHLQLRSREALLRAFEVAGLRVCNRFDVRPKHPKTQRGNDPLHAARDQETTSLWVLQAD